MKRSHRRLVVALAFLLVVAVTSAVLAAQANAGTGVGFGMLKALAETGSSEDAAAVAPRGMSGPGRSGMSGMSCGAEGASCAGEEGGSSCSMGKPEAKSADGASRSAAKPEAKADTEEVAANCPAEKSGDCSTCDEKATCPVHEAKEKAAAQATAAAPDTK